LCSRRGCSGTNAAAERLYLSSRTVEKHVERLLAKTGSSNRAQLATYALRQDEDT
jgi:DNA-binding NarL/FixJ family response regulator